MEGHKVKHEFSGKNHFFKVISKDGKEYNVSIQVNCDCTFMGVVGVANKKICSHILAVMKKIVEDEQVIPSDD